MGSKQSLFEQLTGGAYKTFFIRAREVTRVTKVAAESKTHRDNQRMIKIPMTGCGVAVEIQEC